MRFGIRARGGKGRPPAGCSNRMVQTVWALGNFDIVTPLWPCQTSPDYVGDS